MTQLRILDLCRGGSERDFVGIVQQSRVGEENSDHKIEDRGARPLSPGLQKVVIKSGLHVSFPLSSLEVSESVEKKLLAAM